MFPRKTTLRALLATVLAAVLGAALALPALAQPTVVVPNRVIYPGQEIAPEFLDEVPLLRTLPANASFVMTRDGAVGKVARRTLLPGRMMDTNAMREAYLVEPGSPVRVVFVNGSLVISVMGVPLQSGAAGDFIKVRNVDSGAVFSGVVMADGTIRVGST